MQKAWMQKVLFVFLIASLMGIAWGAGSFFAVPGKAWADADKKPAMDKGPQAVFPETRYEFKPITEGDTITHDFVIENKGEAPLIIEKVQPD